MVASLNLGLPQGPAPTGNSFPLAALELPPALGFLVAALVFASPGVRTEMAQHDQAPPEYRKIKRRAGDSAQCKKLRRAMRARIMVDRRFDEDRPGGVQLPNQLNTDYAARRNQLDLL